MRGKTLVRLVEYGHPLLVWQAAEQARAAIVFIASISGSGCPARR
jgi:hypothetical protein